MVLIKTTLYKRFIFHINTFSDYLFFFLILHSYISQIYFYISISSSYRNASTDLPDSHLQLVSIFRRSLEVFQATSCICTELLYIGSCWSSCLCSSMRRGPQEYIINEFILTSLAVSCNSGSSNLDSWTYSCYFVGCCRQDLFNTARNILV